MYSCPATHNCPVVQVVIHRCRFCQYFRVVQRCRVVQLLLSRDEELSSDTLSVVQNFPAVFIYPLFQSCSACKVVPCCRIFLVCLFLYMYRLMVIGQGSYHEKV